MEKRLFRLLILLGALILLCPAGSPAQDTLRSIKSVLAQTEDGKKVDVTGIVVDTFFSKYFILRDDANLVLVEITEEMNDLSLQRGDIVTVKGTVLHDRTINNNIIATDLDVVVRAAEPLMSTRQPNIQSIITMARDGDVVSASGKIQKKNDQYITLNDGTGDLIVDLGERYLIRDFEIDATAGVIGVVDTHLRYKKYVKAISFAQADFLPVADKKPVKPESVKEVIKGKSPGDAIAVEGRVSQYIGSETLYFLFDGKNILILRPKEGSEDLKLRSGEIIQASGTFDVEELNDKQYGVVKDAVIKRK